MEIAVDTHGFRELCSSRWTVRAASLQSVLDNYEVLLQVWEESKETNLDSEIRARIIGVESQMLSFDFLFGISLGSLILRHSDNLSKSLQHESLSAAEGQELANLCITVLQSLRNSDQFKLCYGHVLKIKVVSLLIHLLCHVNVGHLIIFRLVRPVVISIHRLKIIIDNYTMKHLIW